MNTVFLSYSSRDYFFAEMLAIKLEKADFKIWRDQGAIRAGDDWRQSIEDGITDSFAVVVALSDSSAVSPYVTYEWAYAVGMSKPVIPVKLTECKMHPKLEPTQYIDFSYPRALPWDALVDRLREIEVEGKTPEEEPSGPISTPAESNDLEQAANKILGYLNERGYRMASFERLRQRIDRSMTDAMFGAIIKSQPTIFRHARIKGGKPGIAKRVP